MTVVFSPAAQDDLLDIALFIAQDNAPRALSFVDELESKCRALAASQASARRGPNWARA